MEPKAFEIYRHFKGNLYQIITIAEDVETGDELVIYQGLYAPYKVYARALSDFMQRLDRAKYPNAEQEYRFERVEKVSERDPYSEAAAVVLQETAIPVQMPESVLPEPPAAVQLQPSAAVQSEPSATVQLEPSAAVQLEPSDDASLGKTDGSAAQTAGGVDPHLLSFLDAREPEEKLEALFRIKAYLTPEMLTVMELSQGMEPQEEWTEEERYRHIKNDIITKQKYERTRL